MGGLYSRSVTPPPPATRLQPCRCATRRRLRRVSRGLQETCGVDRSFPDSVPPAARRCPIGAETFVVAARHGAQPARAFNIVAPVRAEALGWLTLLLGALAEATCPRTGGLPCAHWSFRAAIALAGIPAAFSVRSVTSGRAGPATSVHPARGRIRLRARRGDGRRIRPARRCKKRRARGAAVRRPPAGHHTHRWQRPVHVRESRAWHLRGAGLERRPGRRHRRTWPSPICPALPFGCRSASAWRMDTPTSGRVTPRDRRIRASTRRRVAYPGASRAA